MADRPILTLDWRKFQRDYRLINSKYPESVARGFRALSERARDDMRIQVKSIFDLHSDWIPKNILNTPKTNAQLKKAAKAVKKYHDIQATVYLRPAHDPKRSLDFMVHHEKGTPKRSEDGSGDIATPSIDIRNYKYRTGRGKTAKRWRPGVMLEQFNKKGANKKGHKIRYRKPGGKGEPFLVTGKRSGKELVARRLSSRSREFQVLYSLHDRVRIRPRLHMEQTVKGSASMNASSILGRYINRAIRPR